MESKIIEILVDSLKFGSQWGRNYLSANPVIVGVLLGFSLSQGASYFKEQATAKKLERSVRKMIYLEIEHNLTLLSLLRDEVTLARQIDKLDPQSLFFPTWHYKAFESHLSTLPEALNEDKIVRIFKFYGDLDKLTRIYSKMSSLKNASHKATADGNEATYSDHPVKSMFDSSFLWEEATKLWSDCLNQWTKFEQLIQEMQEKGNPLSNV